MSIQDSDFFLIDNGGVVKKVRADKIKADIGDGTGIYTNDKLLVNLSDYSSRFVYPGDTLGKVTSDHWMMVDRSGQNYKVTGNKVVEYLMPEGMSLPGSQSFTSPGNYQFPIPAGVQTVCVVCVGGGGGGSASTLSNNGVSGGGGGGGALMWRNDIVVTGQTHLYVTVGTGGSGGSYSGRNDATDGGDSYVRTGSYSGTILARAGGGGVGRYNSPSVYQNGGISYYSTYGGGGGTGGRGGRGQSGHASGGGGGAGGYSGTGGSGNDGSSSTATSGSGGGGGGGGSLNSTSNYKPTVGGGGVGLYGQGSSGGRGTNRTGSTLSALAAAQGYAGSGGTFTDPNSTNQTILYGGGGAGNEDDGDNGAANGGSGAVRILWGFGRQFPSTEVTSDFD